MRTRSGAIYPNPTPSMAKRKTRACAMAASPECRRSKRARLSEETSSMELKADVLDQLPDDLVLSILCKLSASASSPSDLISVLLTCKRLNGLGMQPMVLSEASAQCLAVRAKAWSDSAHRFLKLCADAGNHDACYILGMIRFYCLESRGNGASLMARAAMGAHAAALYSLAVIQFNGSGGAKGDKDLRAGVALCARAAFLGHVDAIRELGHCLQDGYGVRRNVAEGRRFLIQANAREFAAVLDAAGGRKHLAAVAEAVAGNGCPLLSDFGWNIPAPEPHPANRFLAEWFASKQQTDPKGLRLCSHSGCGRLETRPHEFRRCSVCGSVNYCSRACQALHWKLVHKFECSPTPRWVIAPAGGHAAAAPIAGANA